MSHQHNHPKIGESVVGRSFVLIAGFMLVEFVGGMLANSLTLIADAGHMFLDATALGLTWYALRLSRREHNLSLSYGYHRYQVLASFINGLMLLVLIVWILKECVERFIHPVQMLPIPALIVASIGLVVNLIAFLWLHQSENSAVVKSALLHVVGDLLGSVVAISAALIVYFTGWPYADPILALIVSAILLRAAWHVLRDSGNILLEGVPSGIDLTDIQTVLAARVQGVTNIHHVHAWALTAERSLLTLHANVDEQHDPKAVVKDIKILLESEFHIDHSTIQVEYGDCPDDSPHTHSS